MGTRWRRWWHPTPVLLPGKSHGRKSLVGCSPWGREESDMTERLHFHFSFSCIGEGNGNPLQCSCLENPRDGEPGELPSMGPHRVGHNWSNLAAVAAVGTRVSQRPYISYVFLRPWLLEQLFPFQNWRQRSKMFIHVNFLSNKLRLFKPLSTSYLLFIPLLYKQWFHYFIREVELDKDYRAISYVWEVGFVV